MSITPVIEPERLTGVATETQPVAPEPPLPPPSPQPRRPSGRLLAALILIALGAAFLITNLTALVFGGALILLGLATAFAIGRVVTGQRSLAVPAGVLAGIGGFVALKEAGLVTDGGGWFFMMLGAGFLLTYVLGWRLGAVWPLFPAAALAIFGALIGDWVDVAWLASYAVLAPNWPLVLVIIGGWLLLRDLVPAPARRPIAILGTLVLIVYGGLAVGGTIAAAVAPAIASARPVIVFPGLVGPRVTTTVTLAAPMADGATLRVANTSGRTSVRRGSGDVRVTAMVHHPLGVSAPEVRLAPTETGLLLNLAPTMVPNVTVDYVISVPASAALVAQSTSGDVAISDLSGAVQASTTSGRLMLTNLSGPVTARSTSGEQRMASLTGEIRATSSSGDIDGADLVDVREVTTTSGDVRLSGQFVGDTRITTTSGDARVGFAPGSSAHIAVSTTSGNIRTTGLPLTIQRQANRALSGAIGGGAGTVAVSTTSGDVTLTGQ
ncbi:MAG: DUF4097 family beta strand repeat protein [Chloroflexi bacterium]|nr:DUF4097 family beta strand repeat protein [Chloroflexota bacterium]